MGVGGRARQWGGLKLWLLLVFGGMFVVEAVNAARLLAPETKGRTFPFSYVSRGVYSLASYVRPPHAKGTDIVPPIEAVTRVVRGDANVYAEFRTEGVGLNYPPSALLPLLPLGWIASRYGVGAASQVWDVFARVCVVVMLIIVAALGRGVAARRREAALLVLALLAFYPLRWMVTCVQVQSLLTLCIVVALCAYSRGRGVLTGVLIGFAACVKPYFALLLLFAVARRKWGFVAGALVVAAALIAASIAIFGWGPWQQYFTEILPATFAGYGWWPNQSVSGVVQRYLGNADLTLRPCAPGVVVICRLASLVFCVVAVWPRAAGSRSTLGGGASGPADASHSIGATWEMESLHAFDFALATLGVTLASPIVWEHYFAWTPVLFVLCLKVGTSVPLGTRWWVLLACSYVLLGTYFSPIKAAARGPASLVNAPGLVGALLLLGGAWYAQGRLARFASASASRRGGADATGR